MKYVHIVVVLRDRHVFDCILSHVAYPTKNRAQSAIDKAKEEDMGKAWLYEYRIITLPVAEEQERV